MHKITAAFTFMQTLLAMETPEENPSNCQRHPASSELPENSHIKKEPCINQTKTETHPTYNITPEHIHTHTHPTTPTTTNLQEPLQPTFNEIPNEIQKSKTPPNRTLEELQELIEHAINDIAPPISPNSSIPSPPATNTLLCHACLSQITPLTANQSPASAHRIPIAPFGSNRLFHLPCFVNSFSGSWKLQGFPQSMKVSLAEFFKDTAILLNSPPNTVEISETTEESSGNLPYRFKDSAISETTRKNRKIQIIFETKNFALILECMKVAAAFLIKRIGICMNDILEAAEFSDTERRWIAEQMPGYADPKEPFHIHEEPPLWFFPLTPRGICASPSLLPLPRLSQPLSDSSEESFEDCWIRYGIP